MRRRLELVGAELHKVQLDRPLQVMKKTVEIVEKIDETQMIQGR